MDSKKVNYRESKSIPLFDFLCHYKFQEDWVNEHNEDVEDYQIVEIRYEVWNENHIGQRIKRSFQFGIDDAYFEDHIRNPRHVRYNYSSLQTREEVLSECLPEKFRNSWIKSFWVDKDKNLLIIEVGFD